MKLLLPLVLLSTLASCTATRNLVNNPRPSSVLPCRDAGIVNRGLGYASQGVGQVETSTMDIVDDGSNFVGKVSDRQARDYTNIGVDAVYRTDDIAFRETNRYADYGMDTVDDGASFGARAIRRWPGVVTGVMQRGFVSTKKVYQSALYTYGETVSRGLFGAVDVITPPEPKSYMVGSLNDLNGGYLLPGSGHHCRLPQLPMEPEQEQTYGKNPKNPVTASK
ncbi:MAG: hypothetical protein WAW39_27060 [Prosthecobacter sp.]|uniref:hypothetical protein n=1 Tax=Prosthecobacter sp. TaxID=1965333 RepID=UPI003BB03164